MFFKRGGKPLTADQDGIVAFLGLEDDVTGHPFFTVLNFDFDCRFSVPGVQQHLPGVLHVFADIFFSVGLPSCARG